jgi:hypothetical protein
MPQVTEASPIWLTSFPHVTEPYPDEWFAGLLLRCDEMNHRESGTTFRYLLRSTAHRGFGPGSSFVVIAEVMLEYLAQRLTLSVESLIATTYASDLARLYAPIPPHAGHLLGHRRGVTIPPLLEKSIGNRVSATVAGFRICSLCLAQTRLLRREIILPHLTVCPTHQVVFQTHCTCGSPLLLFSRRQKPFGCFTCGLDWSRLPYPEPTSEQKKLDQALWTLYEFLLIHGTKERKAAALSLIRDSLNTRQPLALRLLNGRPLVALTGNMDLLSLGYVVDLLVSLDISPQDITGYTLI